MSAHECGGCGEMRDVTHGKCADCWRVEAIYLRTNIFIVVEIIRHIDKKSSRRELETAKVLAGALEPLDRDAYLRARDLPVDENGCGSVGSP